MTATRQQIKAVLNVMIAITDAIREAREIPAGHLYAAVMEHVDLATFESIVARIVATRIVECRGHLLVWVGPAVAADGAVTS